MRLLLLGILYTATAFAAYQSLSVPSGATLNCTVPNAAPFTAMNDNRLVMRLNRITFPASGTVNILDCGKVMIQLQAGGIINAYNRGDTMSGRGNGQSVTTSGNGADVTIRFQRFGTTYPTSEASIVSGSIQMDVLDNIANAPIPSWCASSSNLWGCEINTAASTDAHGTNGAGGLATYEIPYIKWYSTTVAPGTPISENESSALADLADFSFDSNTLANLGTVCTGGSFVCVSLGTSGTSFVGTLAQNPICQLTRQYFRAGAPATLSGAVSYPLNGDASITSQTWQQTAGTSLIFSSHTVAAPTVTGGVFGGVSPVFQLTVSDSAGNSRTCSVKDGFVATDANGVITSGDAQIDNLLGPQLRMGIGPVSYLDDRMVAMGDMQTGNVTTYYGDTATASWRNRGPGTIQITYNSTAVVGTSTTFTTTFCQGPGSPTLPKVDTSGVNAEIIVWYPVSTAINPSGLGRRAMVVASCTDNTHMTLSAAWNPNNFTQIQPNSTSAGGTGIISGIQYNFTTTVLDFVWDGQNSRANFYEAGTAYYAAYYRTGIDDYLTAARTFEKNYIDYVLDWGNNLLYGDPYAPADIYWSPLTVALYALDGHPEAWPVLEQWASYAYSGISGTLPWSENNMRSQFCGNTCDDRDISYQTLAIAAAALFSPNAYADTARLNLNDIFTRGYPNTQDLSGSALQYGGVLYYLNQGGGNNNSNSWESNSSVSCTNGGTTCTCNFGTCGFQTAWCDSATPWWFTTTAHGVKPTNGSQGRPEVYTPTSCTSTVVTLDRAFVGTNGTYGWTPGQAGVVGFGLQPYEGGMLVNTMDLSRQALTCTGIGVPTNCSNTLAANILGYQNNIVSYLKGPAYNATYKAPYYFAGFANGCVAPGGDVINACLNSFISEQARNDSGPLMSGVIRTYLANPTVPVQTFGDTLVSALFGRPGTTVIPTYSTDSGYNADLDSGYGFTMTGTPPVGQAHKYWGSTFGLGNTQGWMGARFGGQTAGVSTTISLQFNLAGVPNATQVRVLRTEPHGGVSATTCASSPCNISITTGHGTHILTLLYLSAGGATLAQSIPTAPLITVQ